MQKGGLDWITWILVMIGGLNWGLVGLGSWMGSNLNVINMIFGSWPTIENLIYLLVGLSALYMLYMGLVKK